MSKSDDELKDQEIIENLDFVLNFEIVENEADWQTISESEKVEDKNESTEGETHHEK